jgi:hypothetical protein
LPMDTMPPHRFGTISHESRAFGFIAQRAPTMEPSATSAVAAMKSGEQGIRSASSMIQARSVSGSSVSASKVGTGFISVMMGFSSGHAQGSSAVSDSTNTARSIPARTASNPACRCKSLKSVAPFGRFLPKSGTASDASTACAASRALLSPGLPGLLASSSAQTVRRRTGNFARNVRATGSRLPALKATATAQPAASWMLAPVA